MIYSKTYKIKNNRLSYLLKNLLILILLVYIFPTKGLAQESSANSNPTVSPSPLITPTSIPFSEIISQTESDISKLKEIATSNASNQIILAIEQDLPSLINEINTRINETTQLMTHRRTIEKLRNLENDWNGTIWKLQTLKDKLTVQGRKLDNDLLQVVELEMKWKQAQKDIGNAETASEVTARIQTIFDSINETRQQIETQQVRIISLQNKLIEQEKRANETAKLVKETREALVGQIFFQDSPPLWNQQLWSQSTKVIWSELSVIINNEIEISNIFVWQNSSLFIIQFFILLVFVGILLILRRWVNPRVQEDPNLQKAAVIFAHPIPTSLILVLFLTLLFYSQLPPLVSIIFGTIIFVSSVLIIRSLVEKTLYPVLNILLVFNFVDEIRGIFDSQILVSRLLFLVEMLAGALFFIWLYRTHLKKSLIFDTPQSGVFRTFRFASLFAIPVFILAFFTNLMGFVELSQILGNAVLKSTIVALTFYAFVRIIDSLIIFSLRFRPLSLLKMVINHRDFIQKKIRRLVRFIAFILWLIITLEFLSLFGWTIKIITNILTTNLGLGTFNIKIGDIIVFFITIWAAFALSRFVRFVLEEDIYSRIPLERGLPYAISTLLKYTILLLGFFLAVAGAGFDLTKFTILAGAFGVGIGFGLQNIINNFVSGLILLFERPVKVGDIVRIGDVSGTIKYIGIRASIIHVWDSSDIIVPNSKLISDNVTNWSFSSQQRGIEIIFKVLPETVPRTIITIMEKAAENHPLVSERPMPQVLFNEISFDHLTFKLRVWTDYFDKVSKIHSDLVLNISEALKAENIPHEKIISD